MPADKDPSQADGPDASLEEFWRRSLDRLMSHARRFADGRDEVAEEFVAAAMVKILAYLRSGGGPVGDIESLAFVTLPHVVFDHWRQRRREAQCLAAAMELKDEEASEAGTPEAIIQARHSYRQVLESLAAETGDNRELFHKRFIQELSYTEIARELDVSEALVRKRVQTLRRRLRASVDRENAASPVTATAPRRPLKGPRRY